MSIMAEQRINELVDTIYDLALGKTISEEAQHKFQHELLEVEKLRKRDTAMQSAWVGAAHDIKNPHVENVETKIQNLKDKIHAYILRNKVITGGKKSKKSKRKSLRKRRKTYRKRK
jgi:polyribonucleotide nucleotidyltransferase